MRFTVRSLGGKLVISAALMLLLCMLFFSVTSWFFLKSFYELEARRDAGIHLKVIENAYQRQVNALVHNLDIAMIKNANVMHLLAKPHTIFPQDQANSFLTNEAFNYDLSSLTLISTNGKVLAQSRGAPGPQAGISNVSSSSANSWDIDFVIPIVLKVASGQIGILLAAQHIDDAFADHLVNNTNTSLDVLLCDSKSKRILGTTVPNITKMDRHISEEALCTPGALNLIDGNEHYLTWSNPVRAQNQSGSPPSLV